jgi:Zn-dependent protease
MSWSLKLGRIAGIEVKIHFTFLLLLGWVGFIHWQEEGSAAAVASGLLFILALFGCVVLHELGHALAARRYGIRTRDIILLPIGGVARMERIPENPVHELVVAAAGPLVNVVIAAALYLTIQLAGAWVPLPDLVSNEGACSSACWWSTSCWWSST